MIKLFMYHMIEFINVRENRNDNQQWTETRATFVIGHKTHIYDIHCDLADIYINKVQHLYWNNVQRTVRV